MSSLKFTVDENGKSTKEARGMYSKDGEYVDFDKPCQCVGQVGMASRYLKHAYIIIVLSHTFLRLVSANTYLRSDLIRGNIPIYCTYHLSGIVAPQTL